MSDYKKKYYSPYFVVIFAVSSSVIIYLAIYFLFDLTHLFQGLLFTCTIPAIVSFPISAIMIKHHKKIYEQKVELEKLNRINNKLFAVIGHDIRSPLSIIKGSAEMLLHDESSLPEKEKMYLHTITRRVDNLLVFLNDLLQWSKNQPEDTKLNPDFFNCGSTIEQNINIYEYLIESKQIELKLSNVNKKIFADKNTYSFIIRNLLHNAIKFTPINGKISISIEEHPNEIHTIIEDSGIGIPQENIGLILNSENYFSTQGTQNEIGTGFGIKTCLSYLEIQNGKLLIESKEGQGTKTTIVLLARSFDD